MVVESECLYLYTVYLIASSAFAEKSSHKFMLSRKEKRLHTCYLSGFSFFCASVNAFVFMICTLYNAHPPLSKYLVKRFKSKQAGYDLFKPPYPFTFGVM